MATHRFNCVPAVVSENRLRGRPQHWAQSIARQMRVLTVTTRIAAAVTVFFGVQQLAISPAPRGSDT